MGRAATKVLFLSVFAATMLVQAIAAQPARAADPSFVSFGAGAFDFNRQKVQGGEFRLELRAAKKFWNLKPFVALAGASSGHGFVGAGVLMDVFFGNRIVVTPSFAPHLYVGGDTDLGLDYPIQFRSQLEVAYRFDDRSRLGLAISHYSNASLGDSNPGTETALIYYSIPLSQVFSR